MNKSRSNPPEKSNASSYVSHGRIIPCDRWRLVLIELVTSRWREKHCTTLLKAAEILREGVRHAFFVDLQRDSRLEGNSGMLHDHAPSTCHIKRSTRQAGTNESAEFDIAMLWIHSGSRFVFPMCQLIH